MSLSRFASRKKLIAMSRAGSASCVEGDPSGKAEVFCVPARSGPRNVPMPLAPSLSPLPFRWWRELRNPWRISLCRRKRPVSIDVARRSHRSRQLGQMLFYRPISRPAEGSSQMGPCAGFGPAGANRD
jgi:hypothetical protein